MLHLFNYFSFLHLFTVFFKQNISHLLVHFIMLIQSAYNMTHLKIYRISGGTKKLYNKKFHNFNNFIPIMTRKPVYCWDKGVQIRNRKYLIRKQKYVYRRSNIWSRWAPCCCWQTWIRGHSSESLLHTSLLWLLFYLLWFLH